jgi:putative transposase
MNRKPYPTDISDAEWALIKSMIPAERKRKRGKKREVDLREVVNAVFNILRAGCSWRMMRHDLPAWQTVYSYFQRWQPHCGYGKKSIQYYAHNKREISGRDAEPSAGIIDSQTVKTTEKGGVKGYDAEKKMNGCKRHILVDTMGLILMVVVHAASIQDRNGAKLVFEKICHMFPKLHLIWADAGYAGSLVDWVKYFIGCGIIIIKRCDHTDGFEVLPRRWVVHRTRLRVYFINTL